MFYPLTSSWRDRGYFFVYAREKCTMQSQKQWHFLILTMCDSSGGSTQGPTGASAHVKMSRPLCGGPRGGGGVESYKK